MTYSEENEEEELGEEGGEGEEGEEEDAGEEEDEGDDNDEDEEGDEEVGYDSGTDSNPESESIDMAAIEALIAADRANPTSKLNAEPRPRPISRGLEDVFDCYKPSAMSAQESDAVKSLLRRIFQYEPEKRPSAAELLKDPWFAERVVAEPDRRVVPRAKGKAKRKRSSERFPKGRRP